MISHSAVILLDLFHHHDLHVLCCVVGRVEVCCYWLLCIFESYIRSAAVHPFVQRLLRLPHILLPPSVALDDIHHVGRLAGGCRPDLVCSPSMSSIQHTMKMSSIQHHHTKGCRGWSSKSLCSPSLVPRSYHAPWYKTPDERCPLASFARGHGKVWVRDYRSPSPWGRSFASFRSRLRRGATTE